VIPADHTRVERALAEAQRGTDGRVAVRILPDSELPNTFERAAAEFQGAGLHQSEKRNVALVLVAPHARRYAVLGDTGIHERAGDDFWKRLVEEMRPKFAAGDITAAIEHAVKRIGDELRAHFPADRQ